MRWMPAAVLVLAMSLGPGSARAAELAQHNDPGNARTGRQVFEAYCAKCHSLDPGEPGKRGPHLAGLLQRRYGAVEGFPYRMVWPSADPLWTPDQLNAYLEIHRLAEAAPRAHVIAFLTAATGGGGFEAAIGDPVAGERLYNAKCAYCHALSREAIPPAPAAERYHDIERALERHPWETPDTAQPEGTTVTESVRRGPHLAGLLERAPGAAEGFAYRFVQKVSGATWTPPELDSYIEFHARLEPLQRADLIAFLSKAGK